MKKILSSQIDLNQKRRENFRVSKDFKHWLQEKKEREGFKSMNELMISLLTDTPLIVIVTGDKVMQGRLENLSGYVEILRQRGISFNNQMKLFLRYYSLSEEMKRYVPEVILSMKKMTFDFCKEAEQVINSITTENKPADNSLISANSFQGNPNENLSELITIYVAPEVIFNLSKKNKDFFLTSTGSILRTKMANDTRVRVYKSSDIIRLKNIMENFAWQMNMILKNYRMLLENEFFDYKDEVDKTCSSSIEETISALKTLRLKLDSKDF